MQRLGRNIGGYRGEPIDIEKYLAEVRQLALGHAWNAEPYSIVPGYELATYHRLSKPGAPRIYISTGIHGDEPSGPLSVIELLKENCWPPCFEIWLCPCLNLTGFPLNTRENAKGFDLNRDYRHLLTEEIQTHVSWLKRTPNFDLCLCLHEDWEAHGFYIYELNPDEKPSLAQGIIREVSKIAPIDSSEMIDNWEAREGIIRPGIAPEQREQWAEALFLITQKTRQSYTLETPSDFQLEFRVKMQVTAVKAALNEFQLVNSISR